MPFLTKLLIGAAWIASTLFVAATAPGSHGNIRIGAALFAGSPGLLALLSGADDLFGKPKDAVRNKVKATVQAGIVRLIREGRYPNDISKVSIHVWVLPRWYRGLIRFRIGRSIRGRSGWLPWWLRPRLTRLAVYRIEHNPPSGISFVKRKGIVGRCVALNQETPLHVRLDAPKFKRALRQGEERWKSQPEGITQNLAFHEAEKLAERYGQVMALVIRAASGDAIGCLTFDLPPNVSHFSLRGSEGAQIREIARSTAKHVETHLTGRTTDP